MWALSACIYKRAVPGHIALQWFSGLVEWLQGGMLLALQSLPLGNQQTHVTAWWHPQMLCAALPITPGYELSKETFLSFQSSFCKLDLTFFHKFSLKVWLWFYTPSVPSAIHLYLLMVSFPLQEDSCLPVQPSPTTTASAYFCLWGNAAPQENGSCSNQLSSEGLGRACWGGQEAARKGNNVQGGAIIQGNTRRRWRCGASDLVYQSRGSKGSTGGNTALPHLHPRAMYQGLPGGADSFGAVTPAQRNSPHSYVSGRSAKLVSSSHTFQNYKLTASGRSEGPSAHLTVISVKLDATVVRPLKLFCCFQSLFLCWYCSWWQRAKL